MGDVAPLDELVDGGPHLADRLSRRLISASTFSAIRFLTVTRGSWSTTCRGRPHRRGTRRAGAGAGAGLCRCPRGRAPGARPKRSSPPAPWRWSGAPRSPPRHRPGRSGSARRGRRACCRPSAAARPGRRGRPLRPSQACTRRPGGTGRPRGPAARLWRRSGRRGLPPPAWWSGGRPRGSDPRWHRARVPRRHA
jgi:hypothetical protein